MNWYFNNQKKEEKQVATDEELIIAFMEEVAAKIEGEDVAAVQYWTDFISLTEATARFRGDPVISREYIIEALRRVVSKEVEVECYPGGAPSPKAIYDLAAEIEAEKSSR